MDRICDDLARGEETMQKHGEKLDTFTQSMMEHTMAIRSFEAALNNGIKGELVRLRECFDKHVIDSGRKNEEFEGRLQPLEEFSWFREFMTNFRNSLVRSTLKVAFVVVIALFIVHMADKGVQSLGAIITKVLLG